MINPETLLGNKPLPDDVSCPADSILVYDEDVSLVLIGRALAQYGMTLNATTDGRLRIKYADLSRADILRLNRENRRDSMHFTPVDGICWSCGADILEQHPQHALVAGLNVTGCRKCHRSFCE